MIIFWWNCKLIGQVGHLVNEVRKGKSEIYIYIYIYIKAKERPVRRTAPNGQKLELCTPGQHLQLLDNTWTALCSTFCTWTAASAALLHAWQHFLQAWTAPARQQLITFPNRPAWAAPSSTPDSNLQHSVAPAAPMDSSSCTSSNSQRPAPNCPRQGQQTHTQTSRFFLFLVSC
jgi:hypothetical protein